MKRDNTKYTFRCLEVMVYTTVIATYLAGHREKRLNLSGTVLISANIPNMKYGACTYLKIKKRQRITKIRSS